YTLFASDGNLAGITSGTFNITPAATSQLAFGVQPSTSIAGQSINPPVTVRKLDPFGNLVTTDNTNVLLAIGTNAGGGTLSGTTSIVASGGIATFSNLSVNKAAAGYTLAAVDGIHTSATSNPFNILVAPANHLVFGVQPTNAGA